MPGGLHGSRTQVGNRAIAPPRPERFEVELLESESRSSVAWTGCMANVTKVVIRGRRRGILRFCQRGLFGVDTNTTFSLGKNMEGSRLQTISVNDAPGNYLTSLSSSLFTPIFMA